MNILYIYVSFIAIYFSLCEMINDVIELNFGEDSSTNMFIRTLNETHVLVGTENNAIIFNIVNQTKNDANFGSIIVNGMIEPYYVNNTEEQFLIYEDASETEKVYYFQDGNIINHNNDFDKIFSIVFYNGYVWIVGKNDIYTRVVSFSPDNNSKQRKDFNDDRLKVPDSLFSVVVNNNKILTFYSNSNQLSVSLYNETMDPFQWRQSLSITFPSEPPSSYKILGIKLVDMGDDIIVGVFNVNCTFYVFRTKVKDNPIVDYYLNVFEILSIKCSQPEDIYLYKMNETTVFFAATDNSNMYFTKIFLDLSVKQKDNLFSFGKKNTLSDYNFYTTSIINQNILIFGKIKNTSFYIELYYYPVCINISNIYTKYQKKFSLSQAFVKTDDSDYLKEKINKIYILSQTATNQYEIITSNSDPASKNKEYLKTELSIIIKSENIQTIEYSTESSDSNNREICSLTFIPCDDSCKVCVDGFMHSCILCEEGYYQLEDDPLTCKKGEIDGYYFSPSEELYKKCPEGCLKCNSSSTCFTCNITGGFYPQKQKDNYVTCYNETSKPLRTYIDKEKKEVLPCYYSCENCTTSMSSSKHNCIKCIDKYYFIDDFETNCLSEGNKPLNYYLNKTNSSDIRFKKCYELCRTCSSYGDSSNHNCDSCISPYIIATGSVTKNCILTSDIKPTFEYLKMFVPLGHKEQDELKFVTIDDNFSFIYYIQGALIKNGTFPYLSLDFCEKVLRNNNKDNKLLYIGIIYNKNQRDNLTYQVYTSNGEEIDINSICNEETITKSYPIIKNNTKTSLLLGILNKISQSNFEELYNPSSSFYTQPCSYANFLTEDASIEVRQNMYQYDLTFCPDNCENKGYNQITQMLLCKCTANNENKVGSISEPNKHSTFPNVTHSTSFYLFSCSSLLSEFPGSGANMMHWYILVYIIVDIVLIFTFIQSQNKSFQNSFYQRRSLNTFPAAPVKNKDLTEGIELPEIKSNSNEYIDNNNNEDKNSNDIEISRKNGLKPSMLEIMRQNIDEYNLRHKKFSKEELNILSIEEAVYRDKRNIFEYLLDIILEKVFILSIFTNYNSYYPNCVKFSIHLLIIILLFFFTAGFFSDADSTNRFNTAISDELNYIFSNELSIILYAFLVSFFILNLLDSLMSSYCSLYHYSHLFIKGRSRYKNLLRIIAIKSIIVYIICAVIGGLCWYFLYIFSYMRKQIQTVIVIHSCFAILLIIISQIILAIIASIFRIIGMVCKSKIIFYIGIVFYFLM